jgi:RNA polymerase sigma-70 factor (ECF subfamily)
MTHRADPFRALYDANHERVRGLLARMVGPQEADDLTQVVFTNAAASLPSFRGQAQPWTWLYRIAANVASDYLRSRTGREAKVRADVVESCDQATEATRQESPEQELIRKEMNECIRDVIGQLSETDRTVLLLGDLGGLGDNELAQSLGISEGTTKVRLHRARQRLKQALTGRCDFYRNDDNEFACEPKPAACSTSSPE